MNFNGCVLCISSGNFFGIKKIPGNLNAANKNLHSHSLERKRELTEREGKRKIGVMTYDIITNETKHAGPKKNVGLARNVREVKKKPVYIRIKCERGSVSIDID